jgi:hypothetical protein
VDGRAKPGHDDEKKDGCAPGHLSLLACVTLPPRQTRRKRGEALAAALWRYG